MSKGWSTWLISRTNNGPSPESYSETKGPKAKQILLSSNQQENH